MGKLNMRIGLLLHLVLGLRLAWAETDPADVAALLAFRAALTADPTCITGDWNGDDPCGSFVGWGGIECNGTSVISM
eukprot:7785173-Pyramimonas_sp.AAC.1